MRATWVQQLRELHDESFSADRDWAAHLRRLNESLGLRGRREFATPAPRLPPSWFVGDVEGLEPGNWVLCVGLNQRRSRHDEAWHTGQNYTPDAYWDYWRLLNRNAWYAHYYTPRVRIAAAALGVEIPPTRQQKQEFATTSMVFVELCPYSSEDFWFRDSDLLQLAAEDDGFRIAARIRRILIQRARPAFVLISGNQAVTGLEHGDREDLHLEEPVHYQSVRRSEMRLWHREGHFVVGTSRVPAIGCPALRTRSGHNFYDDVDQVGERARVLVRESRE